MARSSLVKTSGYWVFSKARSSWCNWNVVNVVRDLWKIERNGKGGTLDTSDKSLPPSSLLACFLIARQWVNTIWSAKRIVAALTFELYAASPYRWDHGHCSDWRTARRRYPRPGRRPYSLGSPLVWPEPAIVAAAAAAANGVAVASAAAAADATSDCCRCYCCCANDGCDADGRGGDA